MANYQYPYQPTFYPNYQVQPEVPIQKPASPITWIQGGEATAKSWYVAPNTTVALWDSDEQVIYLKSADITGMPTIKILEYKEREAKPQETAPLPEYVTKGELNELYNAIKDLREEIDGLSIKRPKKREAED